MAQSCQRAEPAVNKLTTKSQLLSSKRVIASAMLSIPVQAYQKEKHSEKQNRFVTHAAAVSSNIHSELYKSSHQKQNSYWKKTHMPL